MPPMVATLRPYNTWVALAIDLNPFSSLFVEVECGVGFGLAHSICSLSGHIISLHSISMSPDVGLGTEGIGARGWDLWIISVVMVVLSALFVGARIAQRFMKSFNLGLDDYTIIAALVASGLLSMTECQAVVYGYGAHYNTLPKDKAVIARKWFYGAQVMYKLVIMLNKISVVCLYYRIFAVSSKYFRLACHSMQAFIAASGAAFVIGTIFQCRPVSAFWDKTIQDVWCFDQTPWWMSYSVVQILTDALLLALPISQVRKLSMSNAEKWGLCIVFSTGLFVTFTSIYRATTLAASAHDPDSTYGPIPATVWAVIEANSGIICACLPMLRHPFLRLFGRFFPSTPTSSNSRKQQSYRLGSRSNPRSVGLSSRKETESRIDDDRESEERIMGGDESGNRNSDGLHGAIFVKNEFTVTASSADDKKSAKSTFGYI